MKRIYFMVSLLAIAAAFSGCSQDEEFVNTNTSQTYQASVFASKGDIIEVIENEEDPGTRAVFVGGNTNRFATLWDAGDVVQVYKDGVNVGTLSLNDADNVKYQGTKDAYLTGTLTGNFAVGDNLELYLPSKARSYTNQDGTINGLSANYSYQKQTVQVDEVSGSGEQKTIKLKKANMDHRQAYMRLRLRDNNDKLLHPSQVTISTTSGSANQLVAEVGEDGTTMTYVDGGIVISTVEVNHEYPGELYVAILNQGYTVAADGKVTNGSVGAYQLTAIDDKGITYVFPGPDEELGGEGQQNAIKVNPNIGQLTNIERKMSMAECTMTMASQMTILQGTKKIRTPKVTVGSTDVTKQCTFTYSSGNYGVARVSPTGEVTGVTPGTATITVTSAAPYAATKTYTVTVTEPVAETADNYVDLGLPSGAKWAKMNVGATSETGAGTYFAFGEIDGYTDANDYTKTKFHWTTYKWCNGSNTTITKYVPEDKALSNGYNNFYDNKTTLEPEDDAAKQNWGGNWSIPTEADWIELHDECTWQWENGTGNVLNTGGVKGYKVSKGDAYIFLPAAGYWLQESLDNVGKYGYYWAYSLNLDNENCPRYANRMRFNNNGGIRIGDDSRCLGFNVRAIVKTSN